MPLSNLLALLLLTPLHAAAPPVVEPAQNLLQGSSFERDPELGWPLAPWVPSQHSGEPSYEFQVEDGVLTITRIATQPWGQVTHQFDFTPHRNQRLRWSIEARGELTDEWGEQMEPTGIGVLVFAQHDAVSALIGRAMLLTAYQPTPLQVGSFDWTEVAMEFDVPANAGTGEVAIRLSMGGRIQVRNPRLVVAPEDSVDLSDPPRREGSSIKDPDHTHIP